MGPRATVTVSLACGSRRRPAGRPGGLPVGPGRDAGRGPGPAGFQAQNFRRVQVAGTQSLHCQYRYYGTAVPLIFGLCGQEFRSSKSAVTLTNLP